MKVTPPCIHCKERRGFAGRGLCEICHADQEILALYPKKRVKHCQQNGADEDVDEETLEKIIAEQRETMPGPEPKIDCCWAIPFVRTRSNRKLSKLDSV
jgi:hypothetical protein